MGLRRGLWWCALLAVLQGSAPAQESRELPPGSLRLANGDVYEGQWMASDGNVIRWQSPWFAEPLLFDCRYLEELTVRPAPHIYGSEPFRVMVRSGDVLHGELAALDEKTVSLDCERHGRVRLNRSDLLKVTRLNNPALIFSGPTSLEGWVNLESEGRRRREGASEPVQYWEPVPGGGLMTDRWRAELYRPLELPERLEIDFQISCSARPEFSLALSQDLDRAVRLETWDDALVLTEGAKFHLVRFIGEAERSLRLRLFWDRATGKLFLYDEGAELLAQTVYGGRGEEGGVLSGFYLRNKTMNMVLDHLRVAKWNGSQPKKLQDQGIRIRTSDGGVLRDEIAGFEQGSRELVLRAGERLKVGEIDTIYFREDESLEERRGGVEFSYPDGTRVTGTLLSVNGTEATLRTAYALEAVKVRLAGLRQIRFPKEDGGVQWESGDELHLDGEVFRGMVSGAGEGVDDYPILWRALGAKNAVAVAAGTQATIVRRRSQAVGNLDGDRLFLKTGEVLSCRVEGFDGKVVRLKTGLSPLREMAADLVKAMEFRDGRLQMVGFSDREWQERRVGPGSLTREAGKVTLNGGGVFHPSLLRGDEIYFGLAWKDKGQSAMTLGLFGGQEPSGRMPLEISFTCWGNRLWVSATETAVGQMLDGDDIMVEGGSASVAIKFPGDRVVVTLNGIELVQFDFPPERRLGNGLLFTTGGPWPNGDGRLNPLAVDRFEVRSTTGLLGALRVDGTVKARALEVPRFRRENPDEHILIGSNGDLVRGRLTGVSEDGVDFVTRLREVHFPRERLAAVVRLEDEDFAVEAPVEEGEVYAYLTDGSAVRIRPVRMTHALLEGESPALGSCQLPVVNIRQLRLGGFTPISGGLLYADWVRRPAPEPVLPQEGEGGGQAARLVNQDAANVSLRLLNGETFQMEKERGKVVVLNFWASWSGQSRQCLDELLKAVESAGEGVRFVTVNQAETSAVIQQYLERNAWSFDVAMDPAEKTGQGFGLESIPHTVVIDGEGKIRWAQSGYRLGIGAEVAEFLKQLVEEAKKAPLLPVPEKEPEPGGNPLQL